MNQWRLKWYWCLVMKALYPRDRAGEILIALHCIIRPRPPFPPAWNKRDAAEVCLKYWEISKKVAQPSKIPLSSLALVDGRAIRGLVDFSRNHSLIFVQGSMTGRPRSCCWSRSGVTRRRPRRRRRIRRSGWKRWTGRGRRKQNWRGSEKRRSSRRGGCISSVLWGLQSGLIALEQAAFDLGWDFCIVAFLGACTIKL